MVDEATGEAPPVIDVADLEIEIHKGPAPDTSKGRGGGMAVNSLVTAKAAEQAALLAGCVLPLAVLESFGVEADGFGVCRRKPAGIAKAQGVIANINAMLKAKMAGGRPSETDTSTDAARRRDPDATDYHVRISRLPDVAILRADLDFAQAIVYINDYPQKARWKVTNKDTMVQVRSFFAVDLGLVAHSPFWQLVETTGASITNKGTFYEPGKEPKEGELPKLHLLIESNDEFRVRLSSRFLLAWLTILRRSSMPSRRSSDRSSREPPWLWRCVACLSSVDASLTFDSLQAEQRNGPNVAPGRYTV